MAFSENILISQDVNESETVGYLLNIKNKVNARAVSNCPVCVFYLFEINSIFLFSLLVM